MVKKILVCCGAGAATSTVAAQKVKDYCESIGIAVEMFQCRAVEVNSMSDGKDLIVSTSRISEDVDVPVLFGVSLLTGIGEEELYAQIKEVLTEGKDG